MTSPQKRIRYPDIRYPDIQAKAFPATLEALKHWLFPVAAKLLPDDSRQVPRLACV